MVEEKDNADKIPAERLLDTVNPFTGSITAKAINKTEPDILLMKYWMPFFAPSLGAVASKMNSNTKTIAILDNVLPHEKHFYDIPLTKYFLNQCDGFVVMSDAVKKDLLSLKPDAKFILHQHPFYDHFGPIEDRAAALAKLSIAADQKVLLFFGFIRGYKGLDILLEAFKNADNDHTLLIAGEPYEDFEKYQPAIDALKAAGKNVVDHIRYIEDHEVPTLFSASDVCVLPYKSATQSGIASIAMHFELPMIVTNVGGLPEEVDNGKTGMISTEVSAPAVWQAIDAYFKNNLKSTFQQNIAATKQQRSWKNLAESVVAFSKTI